MTNEQKKCDKGGSVIKKIHKKICEKQNLSRSYVFLFYKLYNWKKMGE